MNAQRGSTPERPPGGMHVRESGIPGAPAIVFIHGGGQSSRIWHEHMARLTTFHCLAPDLPGFGLSSHLPSASRRAMADLVAELIEMRVPGRRASVVAVSWGGVVVHALLDRYPNLVERAIIDGTPTLPHLRAVRPLFFGLVSPFLRTRPVIAMFADVTDEEDLRAASRLAFWRWAVESLRPFAAIGAACPTLLVAGEKETGPGDLFFNTRQSNAALADLMPHAEARFAPGLGHCWQLQAPDLHIRMVEAWVNGQGLPSELRPEPTPAAGTVERLRAEAAATA